MTPKELGFKMPAEWSLHMGTFMQWPRKESTWIFDYNVLIANYAKIANAISEFEPVIMIVDTEDINEARELCNDRVKMFEYEHDHFWLRDNGPTFIANNSSELAGINWIFNGWGKSFSFEKDKKVSEVLLSSIDLPIFDGNIVFEGGAISTDGEGTALISEQCFLDENRNPNITKDQIEQVLKDYLGLDKLIWLKAIGNTAKDAHIEKIACFVKPGEVMLLGCDDVTNTYYKTYQENVKVLKDSVDAKGKELKVIEVPCCKGDINKSYLNFYIVNGAVIIPKYNAAEDKLAISIFEEVFSDRKIVSIDTAAITKCGGSIRSAALNMPFGIPAKI